MGPVSRGKIVPLRLMATRLENMAKNPNEHWRIRAVTITTYTMKDTISVVIFTASTKVLEAQRLIV